MPEVDEIHSFGVGYLRDRAQKRLLDRLLQPFDLDLQVEARFKGSSGIDHRDVWLGINETKRHAVVVQHGMERAYTVGFNRHREDPEADNLLVLLDTAHRSTIEAKEDLVRREVLFAGTDVQSRMNQEGYTTDLLFFYNVASLETLGIKEYNFHERRLVPSEPGMTIPLELGVTSHYSVSPLVRVSRSELAQNALGVGACFVALDDFTPSQLAELTSAEPQVGGDDLDLLLRLRIGQYFNPPVDELLLGVAAELQNAPREMLLAAAELSGELRHPLAPPVRLHGLSPDDPLAVAEALAESRKIRYTGKSSHITADGRKIVHEFSTTPQESWVKRLAGLAGLIAKLRGFF